MKNTNIFNLPDLGEGLPEAELRQWYVKEGDYVEIDQPIASMETAKALVDIPAPQSGRIVKFYAKANEILNTGAPLVEFAAKNIQAMPAVKALARKFNVDLSTVIPSAPNGSITLDDVKKAALSPNPSPSQPSDSLTYPSGTLSRKRKSGINEELKGTRAAMAMNINKAHTEKVISGVLCEDADIQAWDNNQDYTLRLIRALVIACQAEPALNAHYFNNSLSRTLFTDVNIALALDTPSGLYVPVLKQANKSKPNELREQIDQFKNNCGTGSEPMTEASIALSNFGSIGGRYAMPVIIPPIVAIIAVGRAREQVMAIAGKAEVRKVIPLSLAFDHRAVTGGEAARFLMAMIANLNLQA